MMKITDVKGHSGGECYLIATEKSTFLYDTGFGYCAEQTVQNIQAALQGRSLDYILLTHSHYDHAMGSITIKAAYPEAKVVCSPYAAKIFGRDGAMAVMNEMNMAAAQNAGQTATLCTAKFTVDIVMADGDTLALPDVTVRAIATPGHTRCCTSYYFVEEKFLATSETTGYMPKPEEVMPGFVVSYQMALDSIEKCRALQPERLLLPHTGLYDGDPQHYFDLAKATTNGIAEFLQARKNDPIDEIVQACQEKYFTPAAEKVQPLQAFLENAYALIPRFFKEMEEAQSAKA